MTPTRALRFKVLALQLEILFNGVNHVLRFVLELAMLAALAYWGWHSFAAGVARGVVAVATPAVAAILWGMVLSPKAPAKLSPVTRLVVSLAPFLLAAAALYVVGAHRAAIAFAVVAIVNTALLIMFEIRKPAARLVSLLEQHRFADGSHG